VYPSLDGREISISMHDRIVFLVDPADAELAPAEPRPATGAYMGQPIAELIDRLGPPTRFSGGAMQVVTLEWDSGIEIWVSDGIVSWIRED